MQWSLILLFLMAQCCFMDCQLYQFLYINENKTWTEAQQYCREKHTDLVTVTNMKDMERLINISAGEIKEAWIGLYDQTHGNRTWYWSLPGVEFNESETKWNTGEPRDGNDCGYNYQGKLGSTECSHHLYFLCYNENDTSNKYYFVEERKTWLEAQSYCRENHTDLISGLKQLQDEEYMTVNKKAQYEKIYDKKPVYIGLFRDTWRWSDGSSFSFRYWNKDFISQQYISGQCAMTVFDDGGRWKNENCTERKPFICYDDKLIMIKEAMNWHDALTYCRAHHHDLVTITNMDEQKQVQQEAQFASTPFVWIGLRFNCSRNVWFWVCDNWTWNEQNDCNMFGAMEAGGEHRWFQRNGSERFNFICSKY
ncbi:PREDICTED: macrophage mannose receptor 1-like [Poecilia mexicana]|uniref:macrophage mannose receptor 1-like n=1 Tax=Poecilia mexicana TaxID=48701 RepID=UPI00072EA274|nr:PREDICTED: macrophage mannose receptor 1-like [Poecilia mexicana]